ncbi:cell wall integrity and stress response component 2-like [Haliotis rufescens]|uniref:cell wall integrity and stress response component 2-like n=1 Tax=Haliotis rufescens TaxID=6454 RepID=UPI001EB03AF0|nr:cell wall integrity and stress response component 2-like [Haliotis rufescens]
MAGICRSKLFKVLAVAMVVTVLQTPSAQAQQCDKNKTHTCCSENSRCPSGYFMVSQCDTSSSATSVPSTTLPDDDDDDTFNSTDTSNDTSTDSSNDTSTESSIDTSTDSSNDTSTDAATSEASSTNDNGGTSSSSTPTVYCRRCKDNCSNCSDTVCFTCEAKFLLENGECVSSGASEQFPVAAVAGGVVGGVVLIVAAVVVIACVCRRKRQDPAQSPTVDTPDPSSVVESGVSEGEHNLHMSPDYENMGTKLKDMPTQILRGQDNVLRYTKDPTQPKQVIVPEEHESTYANQATIKLNQMAQAQSQEQQELQQLPTAPGPPRGVQPSKKQKKKKKKSLKAKDQETAQVHPPPEETSEEIYVNGPSTGGGSREHDEEQIYENETSSPYVNLGFQNKM